MSPKTILLLVALAVCDYPLAAQTYYVGTCKSGSFPTIRAAVNSSSVTPGSTIKICAGVYQEQVIISKNLTLQGIDGPSPFFRGLVGSGPEIESPSSIEATNSAVFGNREALREVLCRNECGS
jgi:nitrous oxidase accessory protein NosD